MSGFCWVFALISVMMFGYLPGERKNRLEALQALCPFTDEYHFKDDYFMSPNGPSNWTNRNGNVDEIAVVMDRVGMISWANTKGPFDITREGNRDRNINDLISAILNGKNVHPAHIRKARCKDQLRGEVGLESYAAASLPVQSQVFNSNPLRSPSNWSFVGIDIRRSDGKYPEPAKKDDAQLMAITSLAFDHISDLLGYEVTDCSQVEDMCKWDPEDSGSSQRFPIANAWCPGTCGCDRPDALPI